MTLAGRLGALAIVLQLGACATVVDPMVAPGIGSRDALTGRLSIRVDNAETAANRNVSAAFELSGNAQHGELALSTPLGTMLARAHWAPGRVALSTPRGESTHADLQSLTREVLGEELPVAAMFDWLRGRPWPGAASTPLAPPADAGFNQLGWSVDLAQFGDALVIARREQQPVVTVRVKLDR